MCEPEPMIKLSTFNLQRSGAAKVHWLADMVWDTSFPIDVLAVQELDLHENSVPAFIELLRARKDVRMECIGARPLQAPWGSP